jgi:Na+:H+ antiporter, NhaA family
MRAPNSHHTTLEPLRFISVEAASGVMLLLAAAAALIWANSPWRSAYEALWRVTLHLPLAGWLPAHELHFWINDGLMTIFFLVVGLEIRREVHDGALSDPRVATLPMVAALGGVVVPALVYILMNADPTARRGWAIPTATDIAFAVGVLSLVGRVPPALRVLLLTLAIIDDIVAIAVIAFFYSSGIAPAGLAIVAAGVLLVLVMQRLGVAAVLPYTVPGVIVWYGMLRAGVHPALAGVLLGLLTPVLPLVRGTARASTAQHERDPPLMRVQALLHPYVAFAIMPLFALANAGVSLQGLHLSGGLPLTVALGIIIGLVVGKPVGIALAARGAVGLKLGTLPASVHWRHVGLLAVLGGIGFTMSIYIADLALEEPRLHAAAKFAVLAASGLAGILGLILGRLLPPDRAPH